MHDSTLRKRRFRTTRKQAGMKAFEVWLDTSAVQLVAQLKQRAESLSDMVVRALAALQAREQHGDHASETLSYDARRPAVLARLWAMQDEGLSHQAMATRLHAEGVPTLSGRGQWQAGTVGKLLKAYPRHGA